MEYDTPEDILKIKKLIKSKHRLPFVFVLYSYVLFFGEIFFTFAPSQNTPTLIAFSVQPLFSH